jgi:threonine dehydratase
MASHPNLKAVRQAAERIRPHAHRTPVFTCETLDRLAEAFVYFKCENFQKTGSFKFRGACNAVFSIPDELVDRGVLTHSSGNHAAALALAARNRGISSFIVMPDNAPAVKRAAVSDYGGEIIFCEPSLAARESTANEVLKETGATLVHPYNDHDIICGQGTAALEILEEIPDLHVVMAPVGGGGLLSGTAITASEKSPKTLVVAAEPKNADDAFRSLREGRIIPSTYPDTVADGLRTSLGDLTFPIIQRYVHDIVTVTEDGIVHAMRQVWERMKILIEPSAAVTVAALLEQKVSARGKRVGVILSGGNVDLDNLPWMMKGINRLTP